MFDEVELDHLRERLDPVSLGLEAGRQGLPPPDSQDDPYELPITEEIDKLAARARATLDEQSNQLRSHRGELPSGDPTADVNAIVMDTYARFQRAAATAKPILHEGFLEARMRQKDLSHFKAAHELSRQATYPAFDRHVLMAGVIAVLFVVESIANAVFLARGAEGGLIGAYTIAFGISFINLIPSSGFFGPFSRYFTHVAFKWRLLTGLSTVVYIVIALVLNLGVAHYREISGNLDVATLGQAGAQVVERMRNTPFNLQEAESWLLFGIGLIFSSIAFFDGRKWDDPYPGYGAIDRRMRRAQDDHRNAIEDFSHDMDDIRTDACGTVARLIREDKQLPQEQLKIADRQRRLFTEYNHHLDHLQNLGAALVTEYRDANKSARQDGQIPLAHKRPWNLTTLRLHVEDPSADTPLPSDARLAKLQKQQDMATKGIHDRYEQLRVSVLGEPEPPDAPATPPTASQSRFQDLE